MHIWAQRHAGRGSVHTGTPLCHACKLYFTWAREKWEFKAFSIVRCQQPCSGRTAAAIVCEHKSAGFSLSQHPAGTLPNSLPNYKKFTYGTKAAVCPHYVRYYHAHDCHGLRSSRSTTTNCPPLLKGAKPFPLLRELFQVPELTGARAL